MGKGYPIGYRPIPLFLQCMLGTGGFEDLFLYSYETYFIQGLLKKHEKKAHVLDFE